MNLQEKLLEASSQLRNRAAALTSTALDLARSRASVAAGRADVLKESLTTLTTAGRELNKVAQRHAARFVKENSALAIAAGKDVGALARSTYASLSGRKVAAKTRKPRATRASRKSATSKAA